MQEEAVTERNQGLQDWLLRGYKKEPLLKEKRLQKLTMDPVLYSFRLSLKLKELCMVRVSGFNPDTLIKQF